MRKILSELPEESEFRYTHIGVKWKVKEKTSNHITIEREYDGYHKNESPQQAVVIDNK